MKINKLWKDDYASPILLTPELFEDERGFFFESFNEKWFKENVAEIDFVQDNESHSKLGVIRGLHFQKPPYAQSKLVRVVKGSAFDVAVDIRKGSPYYGCYIGALLTEDNHNQFFIPKGFAHGFVSLSDDTIFQYKCDNFYNKESEDALDAFDPVFGIHWDYFLGTVKPSMSEKDRLNKSFSEFESPFKIYER